MKAFLSWSGDKSKALGESLREWLPVIVQSLEPWLSDRDISPGSCWATTLSQRLDESNLGLICVTCDNLESPWLLFETGALARSGKVVPILFDLEPSDLHGPLAQFQSIMVDRKHIEKLVDDLLRGTAPTMSENQRKTLFDVMWPLLERRVQSIRKAFVEPVAGDQDAKTLREVLAGNAANATVRQAEVDESPPITRRMNFPQRGVGNAMEAPVEGVSSGSCRPPKQQRTIEQLDMRRALLRSDLEYLKCQEEKLTAQNASVSMIDRAILPKERELDGIEAAIALLRPSTPENPGSS